MKSFLCRVMTLVFLFNILTPASGWARPARRKTNTRALNAQVERNVQKAQQDNSPAAQFARAAQQVRNEHNKQFSLADKAGQTHSLPALRTDGLRVARLPVAKPLDESSAKAFLRKVANNEVTFEQLIDYIDPMNPAPAKNDLLTLTYAAEVMGNTLELNTQLDPALYEIPQEEFEQLLLQAQARILYRLALLGFKTPSATLAQAQDPISVARATLEQSYGSSIQKTVAVGTLRLTLLKIHKYYKAKGKKNPLNEYQKQVLAQRLRASNGSKSVPENRRGQLQPALSAKQIQKQAADTVAKNGDLADFQKRFLAELKELKSKNPDPGSYEFHHLQVLAEYATSYALDYNPNYLKPIVAVFDTGVRRDIRGRVKPGDFEQTYSPMLNAIFNTIFENTRYSAMDDNTTQQVLNLLAEFSDPEKYSLPTRVFALEAASLLYRPLNQETLTVAPFVNFNKPEEKLRKVFAGRVVELYCPLNNQSTFGMQNYGLDSEQMRALADNLAYIYDGFYDISTTTISMPGTDPHQQPTQCHIWMKNQPNRAKKNEEDSSSFFWWSANTAFFIFGGDVFQFLGTAYRLTRGAAIALPKATKAARAAANGQKVAAFNKTVRDGAKYANWIYKNKKQQGYFVELITKPTPGTAIKKAGSAQTAEVPETYKAISTTHELQGKYSAWNPKRWVGKRPDQEILGIRLTRLEPNFKITQGEMRFGEVVDGQFVAKPVKGLNSMAEIDSAVGRLIQQTDGTPFLYQTKPYWKGVLDTQQVAMEWNLRNTLERSFKNTMDAWIPVTDLAAEQTFQIGGMSFQVKPTAEMIAQHTKWWNITRWGNPYTAIDDLGKMPIYIAPRSTLGATPVQGGIANIPDILPGFNSTLGDFASGQWSRQAFNAFFKPLNWQANPVNSRLIASGGSAAKALRSFVNGVKRTFLPDYLPTATFYQTIKANPALGARLLPPFLGRHRFVATTTFFAGWSGLDYGLAPIYDSWFEKQTINDLERERARYGNSFSEERAKVDEVLATALETDLSDTRAMRTHNSVKGAQKEESDGTTLVAPVVIARRLMGKEFVDQATKQDISQEALKSDKDHAVLLNTYKKTQQKNEEAEKVVKEFIFRVEQAEKKILGTFPLGFAYAPGAKEKLHTLHQQYIEDFLSSTTQEDISLAKERLSQNLAPLAAQVRQYEESLQLAEQDIEEARKLYQDMPGLMSAKVEKQIRAIYASYVPMISRAQTPKERVNAEFKRDLAISTLLDQLEDKYAAKHPELFELQPQPGQGGTQEAIEYGPQFDPNATPKR